MRFRNVAHNQCTTNSHQTRLILFVFLSQLGIGDNNYCDEFSQRSVDVRQLTRGHIVCPDRCTCSRQSEITTVNCRRTNYTVVPSGIPITVTDLDLSRNNIRELPANGFHHLSSLQELTLHSNNITKLHANAFIGLVRLTKLVLSENPLMSDGLIDFVFSPMRALTSLQLSQCGLITINIKAFLNLTKLRCIDLSSNKFANVPAFTYKGVFVFSKQMTMSLINNIINSISLKHLSYNANLDEINLRGNKIVTICSTTSQPDITKNLQYEEPRMLRSNETSKNYHKKHTHQEFKTGLQSGDQVALSRLKTLNLNSNAIRILSANCFADVTSLEKLVIADNRIKKIDALALNGLVKLKELDLSGNIIAAYEESVFSAASALDTCQLSRVRMSTFPVTAFLNFNNLGMLVLNRNEMTSIPRFSTQNIQVLSNLKILHLAYNKIDSLSDPSHDVGLYDGKDVCRVTELNLDHNLITNLTPNSFARFPLLINLIIANNFISTIDPAAFHGLHYLSNLDISYNSIGRLSDGVFSPLLSLKYLRISNAGLKAPLNAQALRNLSNLEDLCLDFNELVEMPQFTDNKNRSFLKNLTTLSMSSNSFDSQSSLYGLTGLPSIRNIILNNNHLTLRAGILSSLRNLRELTMTKCSYINIEALESMSLMRLILNESKINIQSDTFEEAPMLKVLYLTNCKLTNDAPIHYTFRNMAHLELIDLSQTDIIPNQDTFANSTKITQLNLNGNRLKKLNRNVFQEMINLKSLHLRDTGLVTLDYWSIPENVRNNLEEIDWSKNPFSCDCNLIWFRRWLHTTNTSLLDSEDYICEYPEWHRGAQLLTLPDSSGFECFKQDIDWVGISVEVFLCVFCISSLLVTLLYRFRWHVRYWQSVFTIKQRQYKELSDQREYEYDAFVMYSQQDSHWVINNLRPHLENEERLRLCIHHRDWLGGRDITDNITESIENSRKCLLIVSNAFAASQWCHFELTMAQSRLFQEDRDNLVLVMLEEISDIHVTPRLRLQMQRQTYIEWTDNNLGQHIFWSRLARALRGPDQSVINTPLPESIFMEVSQHGNTKEE